MLDTFRKHSNSSLIYLIFGALIFVFAVSFGQGSTGFTKAGSVTGSTEFAARVNDDTISINDFRRTYQLQLQQFEARTGQPISEEMAQQFGIKKQVLEQMVNNALLVQAAKKRGLAVGDEELARDLQEVPAFQKDGVFDRDTYLQVLQRMGTNANDFESKQREQMLAQKMVMLVMGSAAATDAEVREAYNKAHDRADVTFVRFAPSMFMNDVKLNASDAELDKYAADHAAQVQDFYTRNNYRYNKPQRYQARNILVKAPEGAAAEDEQKAKARIEQAQAALKAGKPFADVAKEFSEDATTKDQGGEMGIFSPGSMDKRLDEAVSKLQAGQYTEPVRTHFGYQIVQVEKIIPAENKKLDEVKREIAQELMKNDAAKVLAQKKAEEALKAAQEGKKLAEQFPPAPPPKEGQFELNTNKLQAQDTGPFTLEGDFVPKIGPAPEIAQAAFQLTPEKPVAGKVYEQANTFFAVELKSREKPDPAQFDKQKEDIRQQLVAQKQQSLFSAFVKELRDGAKVEENQALLIPAGGAPEGAS